jgi:hypothetical protein
MCATSEQERAWAQEGNGDEELQERVVAYHSFDRVELCRAPIHAKYGYLYSENKTVILV